MLLALGRSPPEAYRVRKPASVGSVMVRLTEIPVASAGIEQLPWAPVTPITATSPGPSGVLRSPTWYGAGRVSIKRHGVIGVSQEPPGVAAPARSTTNPAP